MERVRIVSELGARHAPFDVSDARAMAALSAAEDRHFWHRARNEFIAEQLEVLGVGPGCRLVELGCGGGCVTAHLSSKGMEVVGVEGHRDRVRQAQERAPRARFWVHDLSRGVAELPCERFDAAGLFDVLEHLDEPLRALQDARSLVEVGGWVVGTVPALMSLWSRADEQAGHRTRYDVHRLRALVEAVEGCRVRRLVPFHRLLVPALRLRRYALVRQRAMADVSEANFHVPPAAVNAAMRALLAAERRLARAIDLDGISGASLWFALQRVA